MTMKNFRMYCGRCKSQMLSPMDLERDPDHKTATIPYQENKQVPDPNNPENVMRQVVWQEGVQDPAMICAGCLADRNETPTAAPIWVGGSKK